MGVVRMELQHRSDRDSGCAKALFVLSMYYGYDTDFSRSFFRSRVGN